MQARLHLQRSLNVSRPLFPLQSRFADCLPTEPPEVRFAEQLRQLEDMGFTDREQNIRALTATSGNVQFAVERILSGR